MGEPYAPVAAPFATRDGLHPACGGVSASRRAGVNPLGLGAGIALGYATCGEVGFEGRSDYAAIVR